MHHHHRHDAEGALGLALALAWGAIVAWKTTEQQRGKLGRIQDIKIAEVTSSARSNEDNILALQDAMRAQISTLQQNVLALTEGIDEAVADTKGRADAAFTSAEAEVSAGLAASSDKVAGIAAATLASANAAVDAEIAAQASAVDANIQAHLGDWLPVQLKFIGTDVHYNTGEFLTLRAEDIYPGSLTVDSDAFIKIPPRTTWAAVATLNYVVPDGYIYLAFRTPDGATQFGHRVLIKQDTSTGIGLKTMVAVLHNPSTTDFLLVGIRADTVSGASSSFLRTGEYSRISLYRTR